MYDEIELEKRVDRLEAVQGQFIVQTNTSISRLEKEIKNLQVTDRCHKN